MPAKPGGPMSGLHDVELATLAAAGERSAFGELARRHGSTLRGLLRRMGADPALADDLSQDALLSAYEHISEFRAEATFSTWVRKIAARLYLRQWRRRSRREGEKALDDAEVISAREGDVATRLDLDEALQALSASERLCISLCYGAGMSHSEAAEAMKAPIGTVKSHVRRGLDKLRARLSDPANSGFGSDHNG